MLRYNIGYQSIYPDLKDSGFVKRECSNINKYVLIIGKTYIPVSLEIGHRERSVRSKFLAIQNSTSHKNIR